MVKIENHCVGCRESGLHCLGSTCPNRRVEVWYCDKCGEELGEDIYFADEEDLCEECLREKFRKF